MKNKTLLLTKVLIKNGEGFGIKGGSAASKLLLGILLLVLAPVMLIGISFFISSAMDILRVIGQEGVILSWGIAINSVVIFFFGVFYIISTFYFSTDVEFLLPLPLRPKQVIGAKFLVVTIYEYILTAFIFLPILIIYGVKMGTGPLYYLYGLVILLLLPIIPLAAASVLVMLIMRFTNVSRHKDTFKLIGGAFAVFLGLGVNFAIQRLAGTMTAGEVQALLQRGENSLVGIAARIFPTSKWAAEALVQYTLLPGLWNFLIYMTFSIIVFMGLLYLGELIYYKGVVGISETGSRRGSLRQQSLDKSVVKGSVIRTYTLVELRLLFRTPIYFLNCVMINFIWPVIMLFPLLMQSTEVSFIEDISRLIRQPGQQGIVLAVTFALALFLGGSNAVAPTAISREGQELFVKKYIPVSYKDQLIAKILSSFVLGFVGVLTMVVFAVFLFKMSPLFGLLILMTAWLPILLTSFTGVFIDLYNPKLDWDNEQKAVKQNLNVLFNIIIGSLLAALMVFAAFRFSWGLLTTAIVLVIFFGGMNVGMYYLLCSKGVSRFKGLEG